MYKPIIKKKTPKNLIKAKTKLNTIEVLISAASIDSYINHNEVVPVYNVLREHNEIEEEIKSSKNAVKSANKSSNVRIAKRNRLMLVSNCVVCGKKKSSFIKNQETSRLELH